VQSLRLDLHHVRVPVALKTPLRLVAVSDLHLSPWRPSYVQARQAVARANAERPDLVVLLGDYVNTPASIEDAAALLGQLRAPLGVYAVLGNHDHWNGASAVTRALSARKITVLNNRTVVIRKGGQPFCLAGMDDPGPTNPSFRTLFEGAVPGIPLLLLVHNPEMVLWPPLQRADLVLAGHTHGGQIWLAGRYLTPMSDFNHRHLAGLFREGHPWLFVTRGACLGHAPPRWYCPPEIAVLELGPAGGVHR
jgi:predicted MPP superfamily phosphohydrolase